MFIKFSEYTKKYKNLPPDETLVINVIGVFYGFDNKVFGLPLKIVDDNFEMYGCFCSPECVAAFNFNELNDEFMYEDIHI